MTDMRTAFAETAEDIVANDPLAAVVLADISTAMFEDAMVRFPDRLINVGIRESLMISVGGGLALTGMHPIMHSYTPFLTDTATPALGIPGFSTPMPGGFPKGVTTFQGAPVTTRKVIAARYFCDDTFDLFLGLPHGLFLALDLEANGYAGVIGEAA